MNRNMLEKMSCAVRDLCLLSRRRLTLVRITSPIAGGRGGGVTKVKFHVKVTFCVHCVLELGCLAHTSGMLYKVLVSKH